MDLEQIYWYWEKAGENSSSSSTIMPTSRDPYLGELEESFIMSYLEKDCDVFEIGCGDALHTLKYARSVKSILGLDISKSLIHTAQERAVREGINNAHFLVGSIINLSDIIGNKKFDRIISQRCIINLPQWEYQKEVLLQMGSMLREGGLLIMTEGFQEELDNLNEIRKRIGLSSVVTVKYNKNLLHSEFDPFIVQYFQIKSIHDYGFYLVLSRIYHPLAVLPEDPKHDDKLNEISKRLSCLMPAPDFRRYSYNLCYVLQKK